MKKVILSVIFLGVTLGMNAQENKIESTGNVGIGTLNPNFGLTINSTEDQSLLGGNTKSAIRIVNGYASAFGRKSEIQFSLGQSSNQLLAVIAAEYSSWNNNVAGDLIFGTTPTTSTTIIERMRINKDGKVGIGTSTPSSNLEVKTDIPTVGIYEIQKWTNTHHDGYNLSLKTNWDAHGINHSFVQKFNGTDYNSLTFLAGKIGIGTTKPDMKLTVKGKIHAEEVKIDLSVPAPDYVFKKGYKLRSIEEVEKYITKNSHLPEIPSAKEFEKNGIMQAEMDMSLLKKIEELTLYTIQQEKKIKKLERENQDLKSLSDRLSKIEKLLESEK